MQQKDNLFQRILKSPAHSPFCMRKAKVSPTKKEHKQRQKSSCFNRRKIIMMVSDERAAEQEQEMQVYACHNVPLLPCERMEILQQSKLIRDDSKEPVNLTKLAMVKI